MSKSQTTEQPAVNLPDDYDLTLDEFCTRLSGGDKRVELIGGFHHSEKAAGRIKDTSGAFQARYLAFQQQPV